MQREANINGACNCENSRSLKTAGVGGKYLQDLQIDWTSHKMLHEMTIKSEEKISNKLAVKKKAYISKKRKSLISVNHTHKRKKTRDMLY